MKKQTFIGELKKEFHQYIKRMSKIFKSIFDKIKN
jgi:hypothetical protein